MSVTLIKDETKVQVSNMTDHEIGYSLTSGVKRYIRPGVSIAVSAKELRDLRAESGGEAMIHDFLRIENKSMRKEFGIDDDLIEYDWTQKDVDDVLLNKEIDYLLDALDYAPAGIVDMIKTRAIELEIPNMNKRKAIQDKTGVNITSCIENAKAYNEANDVTEAPKKARRVRKTSEETSSTTKTRRVKAE